MLGFTTRTLRTALAALAGVLALATAPHAQCPFPDGLDGPCCSNVTATVPNFPGFTLQGSGFCWTDCVLDTQRCVDIAVSMPLQTGCGRYQSQLSVSDCSSGQAIMSSFPLVLDFTRTWTEVSDSGSNYQVWRFAAKADLSAGTSPGCPMPPCIGPNPTAFFYGYVDYARDCDAGGLEHALVLFHNCDTFIHNQAHSDKPGTYHPVTTYAIVGPDNAANPFLPTPGGRPGGALVSEAMRTSAPVGSTTCIAEEPLSAGDLIPIIDACACPLALGLDRNTVSFWRGTGSCIGIDGNPSSFVSLDTLPFGLPWFHMLTTTIGTWTSGGAYPGVERAFVEEGVLGYHDSCAVTALTTGNSIDIVYGGSTAGGWSVLSTPVVLLTQNFIDVASNFSASLPGPVLPPFTGSVRPTRHLIYANHP